MFMVTALALMAAGAGGRIALAADGTGRQLASGATTGTSATTRLGAAVEDSLIARGNALDARERRAALREQVIAGLERRLVAQSAALATQQADIARATAALQSARDARVQMLARVYTAMKPRDAARQMSELPPELLAAVAGEMRERALAPVMAAMPPAVAGPLAIKLADRKNDRLATPPANSVEDHVGAAQASAS
ncbi:MotE family protein [Sandaracinobacteroides saxicola]|uniref:Magnesium transporter MgtE intracellular domain-containing protein n=1 Tax=Sandaracinobacteroides saxicola TaxID=2759707 RepID=A0A7G5IK21_9SPHN|nr:hypothetical protein [Sandaracinobacteroides saxicola]QMW23713.1 hypothetical protein H3309_04285 [Sandaracinobacteroides saxicola]